MIQEYLFSGHEYRTALEEYNANPCEKEIYDIDNSECWVVTFSKSGENEKSANALSIIHNYVINEFHPIILSNESSAYYNKALYPHFNEFERKLRKVLYLKSALSGDANDRAVIVDLENKDFGEIFTLLFSDPQFVKDTRATVNNKSWQFTKEEIIEAIQKCSENTLWDKLFGKDAVLLLRSHFAKVKTYRNDIMHAHSMKTSKYKDAINLIKKINKQLELEIGKLVGREGNLMNENAEDFNLSLGDALKDMDQMQALKNWQENLVSLQSSIHTIKSENVIQALNTLANAIDLNEVKAIQQNLHEIMQIQLDIPSAISELKRLGSSMQESVPPALLELQKSLEAFKPTPAILKLSQNLKESKGDNSNDQDEI